MALKLGSSDVSALKLGSTSVSALMLGVVQGWPVLEAETAALVARMSVAPSLARKAQINKLIKSLKDTGVWSKLDCFYVLAAHDAQAARLNWKGTSYTLTEVNAPTFTTGRGYQGNGTSSYLDSGFNPVTAGGQFAQNSAHLGVYMNADGNGAALGNTNATIFARNTNTMTVRLNGGGGISSAAGTVASSVGYSVASRTSANDLAGYRNGSPLVSDAANASSAPSSENFWIGARDQASPFYNAGRIAAAHFGSGMSASDVAAINAALAAYLQAVGGA